VLNDFSVQFAGKDIIRTAIQKEILKSEREFQTSRAPGGKNVRWPAGKGYYNPLFYCGAKSIGVKKNLSRYSKTIQETVQRMK